jgi:hypothetical protein
MRPEKGTVVSPGGDGHRDYALDVGGDQIDDPDGAGDVGRGATVLLSADLPFGGIGRLVESFLGCAPPALCVVGAGSPGR